MKVRFSLLFLSLCFGLLTNIFGQNSFTGSYSISKEQYSPILLIKQIDSKIFYEIWNYGGVSRQQIGSTYGKIELKGKKAIDEVQSESSFFKSVDSLIFEFSSGVVKVTSKRHDDSQPYPGFETSNIPPDGIYKKYDSKIPKMALIDDAYNEKEAEATNSSPVSIKDEKQENILFGSVIREGDKIFIATPSFRPSSDVWKFKYVYTDFWPQMPERSGVLSGIWNLNAIIEQLKYGVDEKTLFARVSVMVKSKTYYLVVDVRKALFTNEIEMASIHIANKSTMYKAYLKTLKMIGDNTVVGYINNFEPVRGEINEFEKRRLIQNARIKVDSMRNSSFEGKNMLFLDKLKFDDYDFNRKSFTTQGVINSIKYNFDSQIDGVNNVINLQFKNVGPEVEVPMSESLAEELTSKYFQRGEKIVYCIYTFDLEETTGGIVKGGAAKLLGLTSALIQKATVTKMSFYSDDSYSNKIAEYRF